MSRLIAILAAIVAWGTSAAAGQEGVPSARNLMLDGTQARSEETVLLVAFVSPTCGYCERVLNEFLIPMSRNPEYQRKLVMRRIDIGSQAGLKDFDGGATTQRMFAGWHGINLVPTVMLFDDRGNQLAKPLVGLTTVDYYGYYLDQAIDEALAKVRGSGSN